MSALLTRSLHSNTTRLALLAVQILAFSSPVGAQQGEPLVILRTVTDAGYKDTDEKLALLKDALSQARVRAVSARKGEDPSSVIARTYGFGHSDEPESYRLVADSVLALNGGDFKAQTEKGIVLVPDIGPWAKKRFNPAKAVNYVPKIVSWEADQLLRVQGAPDFLALAGKPKVIDAGRRAAQSIISEYTVPAHVALAWIANHQFNAQVFNFPFSLKLAEPEPGVGDSGDHLVLTASARTEIANLLRAASSSSLLAIADTGWPVNAYEESVGLLTVVINTFRQKYLHLSKKIAFPLPLQLQAKVVNEHAEKVFRSLREFGALDAASQPHVKIVYLPLTQEQGGGAVIREFIAASYLYSLLLSSPQTAVPSSADQQHALDKADLIVKQLSATWPAGSATVLTDKAVLESYMLILNKYAEATDTTFLLSESWTVPEDRLEVAFPSPMRGAVVAATGNNKENVISEHLQFAQRCLEHRDTIAVMNIDGSGVICDSGQVDEGLLAAELAVGFDGLLGSSCVDAGTSFSTPRVAWLFAAADALRKKRFNMDHWGLDALNAITRLRSKDGSISSVRLDPLDFIRDASR